MSHRTRIGKTKHLILGGLVVSGLLAGALPAQALVPPVPYIAYTATSYWNTPLSDNAPVDPNSARYINEAMDAWRTGANDVKFNYMQMRGTPDQTSPNVGALPLFFAQPTDRLYTINAQGRTVHIRIPANAFPGTSADGAMQVIDRSTNQIVGMWHARKTSTGWAADAMDRQWLNSGGIIESQNGGTSGNFGHYGVAAGSRVIRVDEVRAGKITHRLEAFWHETAQAHFWPMSGHELGKGGIVPEGIVIRIKPSIDLTKRGLNPAELVIATAFQDYGAIIGDNSGVSSLHRVQFAGADWKALGVTSDSLKSIPWTDWEFVKGGYDPR